MSPRDSLERVVAALHDAALDEALWPAASALIDEAVGIKGSSLAFPDSQEDEARLRFGELLYRGEQREDGRDYFAYYHR